MLSGGIFALRHISSFRDREAVPPPSESSADPGNSFSAPGQQEAGSGGEEEIPDNTEKKLLHRPVQALKMIPTDPPGVNRPNLNGCPETPWEGQIYSYVQVPDDLYDKSLKWSGDWGRIMAGGQEFIYFGCGVCCLSNTFSTFRQKPITPDIIYQEAKDYASYNPDSGIGAMSWEQLAVMCRRYGLTASLRQKPGSYAQFQKEIREADTAIVLVSKQNDDKLWWYTNGHYVSLWSYDPYLDSVFLSDPSGLFNRARVMLIDIYNALKTSSNGQYLVIGPDPGGKGS